ncbi:hypothetical protein AB4Y38_42680 [Paraburkholderia sp. EG285A]|uniref:hypothetical protein n=1 Tax=Paraburkholderia sp. EG285A TaxID=3237009 RepID=UPI0034D1BDFB
MQNYIYISEGDLQAWIIMTMLAPGRWEAFVFFEMRATHGDETSLVTKRRVQGTFDDEEEAERTACAFALECMCQWSHKTASIPYLQVGAQEERSRRPVI